MVKAKRKLLMTVLVISMIWGSLSNIVKADTVSTSVVTRIDGSRK